MKNAVEKVAVDVLVYGGTAAGVSAALAAARAGRRTVLVERGDHLGGMVASGLGLIDVLRPHAVSGIALEFKDKVLDHYTQTYGKNSDQLRLTYGGVWPEPHVAEMLFDRMCDDQPNLSVLRRYELQRVDKRANTVIGSEYLDRDTNETRHITHRVAIDGTYEGDFAAAAGVAYRLGREGRQEYGERFAGEIYMDWRPHHGELHPASTGEPSEYMQAYCFRSTMCTDPGKRIPIEKPDSYQEFYPMYRDLLEDMHTGRVKFLREIVWLNPLSNMKATVNGHIEALTSMDVAEVHLKWSDGDWDTRQEIFNFYKEYSLGLWYFLQDDPGLHIAFHEDAGCFGLPPDEYPDDGHWAWQLYVRESRRIVGEYTLTEHDSVPPDGRQRPPIPKDAVAIHEHAFDCHACRNRGSNGEVCADDGFELLEGTIWYRNRMVSMNRPSSIPYGVMVPQEVDGLLVPVAMSSSHVAYTTFRHEPIWMATGQAAGNAAAQAIDDGEGVEVRSIDVGKLQRTLVKQRHVLAWFNNLPVDDPRFEQVQLAALAEDYPEYDAEPLHTMP